MHILVFHILHNPELCSEPPWTSAFPVVCLYFCFQLFQSESIWNGVLKLCQTVHFSAMSSCISYYWKIDQDVTKPILNTLWNEEREKKGMNSQTRSRERGHCVATGTTVLASNDFFFPLPTSLLMQLLICSSLFPSVSHIIPTLYYRYCLCWLGFVPTVFTAVWINSKGREKYV